MHDGASSGNRGGGALCPPARLWSLPVSLFCFSVKDARRLRAAGSKSLPHHRSEFEAQLSALTTIILRPPSPHPQPIDCLARPSTSRVEAASDHPSQAQINPSLRCTHSAPIVQFEPLSKPCPGKVSNKPLFIMTRC